MRAQETVDLLRRQRHDFANHLQVLRGYLELDQPSRALDYLLRISQELTIERQMFINDAPETSLFLYRMYLLAMERGLAFQVEDIKIDDLSEEDLTYWDQEMQKIYNEVGHLGAAQREDSVIKASINNKLLRVEVTLESGPLIREIVLTR